MNSPISQIRVGLELTEAVLPLGRFALRDGRIYFEYDPAFLDGGLEVSPFNLPLRPGVQTFDPLLFEGLPGVFNDSLPDGWGRLLFDRMMRSGGVPSGEMTVLDRLAHVGRTGMGALVYEPDSGDGAPDSDVDLDQLAAHAQEVLDGEAGEVLEELLALSGSSAGARPKVMIGLDAGRRTAIHGTCTLPEGFEPWLVKFPTHGDGLGAGAIEYVYALMAKNAGLDMTDVNLFPARKGAGYFATKRFDRRDGHRLHAHSACGLLHSDFRTPSLDYEDLIALTMALTRDTREAEKMFRLAVFNVLAHNRDDHSKNFSFLMDAQGDWTLSPAYDLTYAPGPGGEQSTLVMGEGRNPGTEHLIRLGLETELTRSRINDIMEQVKAALSQWRELAKEHGVAQTDIDWIAERIESPWAVVVTDNLTSPCQAGVTGRNQNPMPTPRNR